MSPPAQGGTCISLRVLRHAVTSLETLCERGTMSRPTKACLQQLVAARRSFLVIGGTGSGKTTLLAALLGEVSHRQRIICIEDTAELRAVAEAATVEGETIHNMPFPVTAEDVVAALTSIEQLSRRVRAEHGLPEPIKHIAEH